MVLILPETRSVASIIGSRQRWATGRLIKGRGVVGRCCCPKIGAAVSCAKPCALVGPRAPLALRAAVGKAPRTSWREPPCPDPHPAQHAVPADHVVEERGAHMHGDQKEERIGSEPMPVKNLRCPGIILGHQPWQ